MNWKALLPVLALSALIASGCDKKPEEETPAADPAATAATTSPPAQQGGTGGVTPMAGVGAGPMTPVSGAESVQGGGSAAGQVLKDKAKGLGGTAPSSIDQMGGE